MENEILVLGAAGKTGKRVVNLLRDRGVPARAASRSSHTRFDWDDSGTWEAAIAEVSRVYLVAPKDPAKVREFVTRFLQVGGSRVVLLSAQNPVGTNLAVENAVTDIIPEWTILRPSWFSQNFTEGFFASAIAEGVLRLHVGQAPIGFIDADDIAAAAVAALTEDGHNGKHYELTGPHQFTFAAAVREISRHSGRDVRYEEISESQFRQEQRASGASDDAIEQFTALLGRVRDGEFSGMAQGVEAATGQRPRDFAGFVAAAAASEAWGRQESLQ